MCSNKKYYTVLTNGKDVHYIEMGQYANEIIIEGKNTN